MCWDKYAQIFQAADSELTVLHMIDVLQVPLEPHSPGMKKTVWPTASIGS